MQIQTFIEYQRREYEREKERVQNREGRPELWIGEVSRGLKLSSGVAGSPTVVGRFRFSVSFL